MFLKRTPARSADEVASDFGQLVDEGRALLREVMDNPQERVANLRSAYDDASERLAELQSSATRVAKRGVKHGARYARQADQYLHENPWPTVAGAIVVGVLATLWWTQRRL